MFAPPVDTTGACGEISGPLNRSEDGIIHGNFRVIHSRQPIIESELHWWLSYPLPSSVFGCLLLLCLHRCSIKPPLIKSPSPCHCAPTVPVELTLELVGCQLLIASPSLEPIELVANQHPVELVVVHWPPLRWQQIDLATWSEVVMKQQEPSITTKRVKNDKC